MYNCAAEIQLLCSLLEGEINTPFSSHRYRLFFQFQWNLRIFIWL